MTTEEKIEKLERKNRRLRSVLTLLVLGLCALAVMGQTEGPSGEPSEAEAAMVEAFGKVPVWLEAYPDHARESAWKWQEDMMGQGGVIPFKYAQLISLAVAAQIPCDYCTYAHTEFATQFGGASQEELRHAVAISADVRHWSTVLNGAAIDLTEFKGEMNSIIEHVKAKSAAAEDPAE
jgi:AhpD family alkylhydroperoxidase